MTRGIKIAIVSLSTLLLATLMIGTLLGGAETGEDAYKHFAVFTEVVSRVKSDYVEEPDMKSVTLGAVNGLLESVDPYASYLSADQYKQYLKAKDAKKASVGLLVSRRFGYVGVVGAIPGSPAEKANLNTGDVLETINGVATRDMPLAYAEMLLDGDPGTTLELTVMRVRRGTDAQKVSLIREIIRYPSPTVKSLNDGIAVLQVPALDTGKVKMVAAKLAELQKQGATKLILDLRNNAFGAPAEGLALANLFVESGKLAYIQGQRTGREESAADPAKAVWKLPLAVLVNRGTAGAAEVAASAILDNKRGDIVGERTYGDAAIRRAITMDDGSAVILSTAKYYSMSGKAIQDNGVTPGTAVAEAEERNDEDDDAPAPAAAPKPAEDLALAKALEILSKK